MNLLIGPLSYEYASEEDFEELHALRLAAMRPSLEALGIFNPERSRQRFRDSFRPDDTLKFFVGQELVGFIAFWENEDHIFLNHLYVATAHQGKGFGAIALKRACSLSRKTGKPVRLGALRGSDSNRFYQREGFVSYDADEHDIYYEWKPAR